MTTEQAEARRAVYDACHRGVMALWGKGGSDDAQHWRDLLRGRAKLGPLDLPDLYDAIADAWLEADDARASAYALAAVMTAPATFGHASWDTTHPPTDLQTDTAPMTPPAGEIRHAPDDAPPGTPAAWQDEVQPPPCVMCGRWRSEHRRHALGHDYSPPAAVEAVGHDDEFHGIPVTRSEPVVVNLDGGTAGQVDPTDGQAPRTLASAVRPQVAHDQMEQVTGAGADVERLTCGLCPADGPTFASRDERVKHVLYVHPKKPRTDPTPADDGQRDGRYPCGVGDCTRTFEAKQSRGQHRRKAHPGWNAPPAGRVEVEREPVEDTDDQAATLGTTAPAETTVEDTTPTPPPAAAGVAVLCRCGHGERMHERDEGASSGRGVCFRNSCDCSEYRSNTG